MAISAEWGLAERTQRIYSRVGGFLFLWLIVNAGGATLIIMNIGVGGNFEETAARIAASERLYRVALSGGVIETLSSVLLAFALYATLKKVNSLLALLGMVFGLQDSFLECIVRISEFTNLHLYLSRQIAPVGAMPLQQLVDLLRSMGTVTENVGGICFGMSALLFFFLFFQSGYLPRILSACGLFASLIWSVLYFANLIFPIEHTFWQYLCFPPMAVVGIATGVWLAVFGIDRR